MTDVPKASQEGVGSGPEPTGPLAAMLRRGAMISGLALVIVQIVGFIQILILARLLNPAEVGVFAAGVVVATFLLVFAESGLSSALVQRGTDVDEAAETVFWATVIIGAVASLAALAVAPLVGRAFGSDVAGAIAAAISGTVLLHSFTVVPDYLMQRRFNFMRRLIVDPAIAISHAIVAITFCALGFGVWGLVLGSYASFVAWVVATWMLAGWRPGRARSSVRMLRELLRYSLPMFVSGVAWRAKESIETVVVGSYLDPTALGHFRYGRRLSQLPGVAVVQIASYVLFPAFSRIAGDAARFKRAYLRALGLLWLVAVPVAALIVAIGEPMVVVLLGERWREAGVAFVMMAGYGLGEAMGAIGQESIMGSGRSRLLNVITVVSLGSTVGLLLLLAPYGIVGVGLAISGSAVLMGATSLARSRRVVGVSWPELLRCLLPPLVASLAAVAVIGPLEHMLVRSDRLGLAGGLGALAAEAIGFLAVYAVAMRIVAPAATRELTALVSGRLPGRRA